jgi:hypothetical protein
MIHSFPLKKMTMRMKMKAIFIRVVLIEYQNGNMRIIKKVKTVKIRKN